MRILRTFLARFVGLTCKPDQAFIVYVDLQGVCACNKYIDSKIKLEAIDQERVRYILADYIGIILR